MPKYRLQAILSDPMHSYARTWAASCGAAVQKVTNVSQEARRKVCSTFELQAIRY